MKPFFTYTILQYKHSIILREAVNIGVLFHFPDEERFEFAFGNHDRAKKIYPDFDTQLFNIYIKNIQKKLKRKFDIYQNSELRKDYKSFINDYILGEDESVLQFTETNSVVNIFGSSSEAIKHYSALLLPGVFVEKPSVLRHSEVFIIKKYTGYLFDKSKGIESKLVKNKEIATKDTSLKFELSWQHKNALTSLVKPISFDLNDELTIQSKSATYFGYLSLLSEYAKNNNCRFDLLISEPGEKKLYKQYEKALNVLDLLSAPKKIITEDRINDYSEETLAQLIN